jgi:hypothetical protein
VTLFEEAGYVGVTPGWPDPETVAEARKHPEVFAGKGIGEIADYEEAIIRRSYPRSRSCSATFDAYPGGHSRPPVGTAGALLRRAAGAVVSGDRATPWDSRVRREMPGPSRR